MMIKNIEVYLNEMPTSIGIIQRDTQYAEPRRYYDDNSIVSAWNYVSRGITGQDNVLLTVVGFMPDLMLARFAAWCKDCGVVGFYRGARKGLIECVYDERVVE
jgi:hypothetical protein